MGRFTLPRDLYHGKGSLEVLKNLKGKRAVICVGGSAMASVCHTKIHIVKAMVFPVVMYGCESWIIKKAEH